MIYEFSDLTLDLDRHLLIRGGQPIKLTNLSFKVLQALVQAAPALISHDDLIDQVWGPKRVITPDNLSQRMKTLRQSLGDDPNQPIYIEGVRGRGYRLVAEVKVQSARTYSRSSRRALSPRLLVSLVVLALALGYIAFDRFVLHPVEDEQIAQSARQEGRTAALTESHDDKSIAVLPFDNRSSREEDQFFTDGIHDDLLATISKIGSMKVISRTSVMEYRDTIKKIPQIAQELGVEHILEGGVQRSGNQVRINVQLIDAVTDEHLWAEIYDRELTAANLFAVQSEITKAIAEALQATLSPEEEQHINKVATENLQALEAYLRGRQLMATRDPAKLKLAAEEFSKATRFDPMFALAWVGVADSNDLLTGWAKARAEDQHPIIEDAVNNALAIDSGLGEAHASLAMLRWQNGRLDEAETALQKAIELSPNYASAYQWYSQLILKRDPLRIQESIDLMQKAAILDPRSAIIGANLGGAYYYRGLYQQAERQYRKVIELHPDFATVYSYLAYQYQYAMGQFDKALPLAIKAATLNPENDYHNLRQVRAYMQLGDLEAAQEVRDKMADSGAIGWMLDYVDVLIRFDNGNPTDIREAINRLLPKMQHTSSRQNGLRLSLGLIALARGDIQLSREIYLSVEPRWLEPDQWPALIISNVSSNVTGCIVASLLMNTGDQELGAALLQQSTAFIEDPLTLLTVHPDQFFPDLCYLTAGDTEKALLSIETQLDHNHLNDWNVVHKLRMYDLIRNEPRYQAAWAERERRIAVQREAVDSEREAGE
jgi:TolB-like protein/DNA-binding winged helix-turn-helix (wHTH) protein/Tfp pilus assembly protein PilF